MPVSVPVACPPSGLARHHHRNTALGLHAGPFQRVFINRVAVRHVVYLGLVQMPFHRQQPGALFQPATVPFDQAGEGGEGAGHDFFRGRGELQ